jgi:hypothetical protein
MCRTRSVGYHIFAIFMSKKYDSVKNIVDLCFPRKNVTHRRIDDAVKTQDGIFRAYDRCHNVSPCCAVLMVTTKCSCQQT